MVSFYICLYYLSLSAYAYVYEVMHIHTNLFNYLDANGKQFLFSDEQNCGKPRLLIEESWGLLNILFLILLLTAVLLFIILCGVRNYKNQVMNGGHHSVILPPRRPLPRIASDLLPSCPPPAPLLPPSCPPPAPLLPPSNSPPTASIQNRKPYSLY
jgi:hypothetical protein